MSMMTVRIRDESLGIQWRRFGHPLRLARGATIVRNLATTLLVWLERARERRQLLSLSDGALQDFGANRCDAACEGDKPFWRA
jgi:uncharacterized protein YjiS (DUF1127 family)